jgi:hypothetical protein
MRISNAKYERKHGVGRERYEAELEAKMSGDFSHFEIPRYEELTFLRLDPHEE